MKPVINRISKKHIVITKPNMRSPKIQFKSSVKGRSELEAMKAKAEEKLRAPEMSTKSSASSVIWFWKTVIVFTTRLQSDVAVEIHSVCRELSRTPSFSQEGFDQAVKALFGIKN